MSAQGNVDNAANMAGREGIGGFLYSDAMYSEQFRIASDRGSSALDRLGMVSDGIRTSDGNVVRLNQSSDRVRVEDGKVSMTEFSAQTFFRRTITRSTWFTQIPVTLSISGSTDFGNTWQATVSRAGDFLLQAWLRVTLTSAVLAAAGTGNMAATSSVRWTRNFMHNLIDKCKLTFNGTCAQELDNYFLDFWAAFTVPSNKRNGYDAMIGNSYDMLTPVGPSGSTNGGNDQVLTLPLPFFFSRDSSNSLPTSALPFNEIKIEFSFRNWRDLLVHQTIGGDTGVASVDAMAATAPTLQNVQVWANYALVSNAERTLSTRSGEVRDMLMEQNQTSNLVALNASNENNSTTIDLRFGGAVKALFFGARNKTIISEWSNYTAASAVANGLGPGGTNFYPSGANDPIVETSLQYENSNRLEKMGSDYYSLIQPYYQPGLTVPEETGYHMYSYALDLLDVDPTGSTDFGRLNNVTLVVYCSSSAANGEDGSQGANTGQNASQSWNAFCVALSFNVMRVSGGSISFPFL